uniref:HAT C-terminal dimerisation domain-containing protein n=1 Tax=Ditylenchus dipsaci TaxID=166011 RepID=A0A915DH03_9BILA
MLKLSYRSLQALKAHLPSHAEYAKKVAELESKNQEKVIAQRETMEAHFGKSQVTSAIGEDKTIKEILEKCRRLVGHFNHSNQAKDRLREEQEREEAPLHRLVQVEHISPPPKLKKADVDSFFAQHSHLYSVDEDDGAENSQDVMTEIDSYLARRCIGALEDPLEFWKDHQKDYTHLGRIARRYLAAPATSIASESTFSVARDVFDYKRSRLSPQNAEMLLFLNRNLPLISFNY